MYVIVQHTAFRQGETTVAAPYERREMSTKKGKQMEMKQQGNFQQV